MSCECESQCPTATHCYCIYTYEDGICVCVCDYPMVLPASARAPKSLTSMVDLCIKNVELADLAAALDSLSDANVLIPAARARTKVSLHMHKIPLGDALSKLGLLTDSSPSPQVAS
ncbi:hypothetical protein C3941_06710 [Kaistia algarum]|uniref:hypothetical protein n=1 Tax=Kaistia algarum TaxID=2083279 RepID=UPI000CE7AD9E|nr:hypothetical protein [Kaistia algarum]MCX5515634.1 hypothetical protein [Kaistia algarum]PPE80978.1 hypothetical protein C3941_06710 [Kaistia algarum]